MTKLATIEKITEIKAIEKADRILAAKVLGYWTVIKKDEYKVGDFCVFHVPDTVADSTKPQYSFLEKNHWRIKCCKLRGQISQGLALPLKDLFQIAGKEFEVFEGMDVSEIVGITKYENPALAKLSGDVKGLFPPFLIKTDELSLRTYNSALVEFLGLECYISTKNDGASGTFFIKDNVFGVCSRNLELKEDDTNTYWRIAKKYGIEEKLCQTGKNISIQGEIIGPGLQGNKMGLSEIALSVFNVFDIDTHSYFNYDDFVAFCDKLELPRVKEIWRGIFNFSLEELINLSNEQKYENNLPAEGIVLRPCIEKYSPILEGRLSGKIINENFALKYGL